jgi:hypothetical protein
MPPIRYVSLADLKPWPGAARTHSKKQIRQIAESIRRFGFINPIVIDEDCQVLAGHGRVEAARIMKLEEVPALRIDTMSEAEKRAYTIADNKLALNAGWDRKALGDELERLLAEDLYFDVSVAGVSATELAGMIGGAMEIEKPSAAMLPPNHQHRTDPVACKHLICRDNTPYCD